MRKAFSSGALLILVILVLLVLWLLPPTVERRYNVTRDHEPYPVSEAAQQLHDELLIGDLHSDSLLWSRDLRHRSTFGHVDIPRLAEGNVGIQVFAAVTKSPRDLRLEGNQADSSDNITLLAMGQLWPTRTWDSLLERALYQSERLQRLETMAPEKIKIVRTSAELETVLKARKQGEQKLAALLATEGSHALDGQLANIPTLHKAGFRIMGLHHFFDNKLGGSLHGQSDEGLTTFGRAAVNLMEEMEIIIDVAHSSPQSVLDTLAITSRPIIVSHTGMRGRCDSKRNIPDALIRQIARRGGLIGIGYWADATCDDSPAGIAHMIAYATRIAGVDHVALGSDFDGAVTTALDTSELAAITQALLEEGMTEPEIRKVMGENMKNFLLKWLPRS